MDHQTNGLSHQRQPVSIAVFRALQLGDLLCAVPAVRALRSAFPRARISLIALPGAAPLVKRLPAYIDEHIPFPGYPGLPDQPVDAEATRSFISGMQARGVDLLIQMHGKGDITNPLVTLLGARSLAGFYAPGGFCPDPATFLPYPFDLPEVHRHLSLMRHLGIPAEDSGLEFPLLDHDEAELAAALGGQLLPAGTYVVVHAGARSTSRRWRPGKFATVADALSRRGLQVVLTGSGQERPLAARVAAEMDRPALNLSGRTSLGALALLVQRARLLVCNDTGVSHLAAAVQTPSVVIFTGSDPGRWAPLDRNLHRSVGSGTPDSITPTLHRPPSSPPTVASVLHEALELLAGEVRLA